MACGTVDADKSATVSFIKETVSDSLVDLIGETGVLRTVISDFLGELTFSDFFEGTTIHSSELVSCLSDSVMPPGIIAFIRESSEVED